MRANLILILCLFFLSWTSGQTSFTDVTAQASLLDTPGAEAVAVGDFNNDGYDDFYLCYAFRKNELYLNLGDGTFEEVAENAGVALADNIESEAAVWGDINNDGWLDLYVGNRAKPDRLFLNMGDETFSEISFAANIIQLGNPKSVNMADINNDGFLDIYISNFMLENVMYLNNGDNTFTYYTLEAGAFDNGLAMGTIFFDYDKDGDQDLYLVHDGYDANFLYQNDGTGSFTEVGAAAGVNTESFGMGVDVGDINNDGWLDIYIANLGKNILLLNNADGTFTNISESANVEDNGMGWGTNFLDYDNDGLIDIYVANETAFSPHPNVLYRNMGDLSFERAEETGDICNEHSSYGTAYLDYNLDGNLDMLVANKGSDERSQLFRNAERSNNWVSFKLIGTNSNRSAIGAKVRLVDDLGQIHFKEIAAGQSWGSHSSTLVHFGLGSATAIDSVIVSWPSGLVQEVSIPAMDSYYTIKEGLEPEIGIVYETTTTSTVTKVEITESFQIFPNPNQGQFTVSFSTNSTANVLLEVHDILGRRLATRLVENPVIGKNEIFMQMPEAMLTGGSQVLTLRLVVDDHTLAQKFIIKK